MKAAIVVAFFAGAWLLSRAFDARAVILAARASIAPFGAWAPVAFVLFYVAAVLLFVPGTPLTLLAALLFGSVQGFVVMVAATTLSAASGFLIARHLFRERIERWLLPCRPCQRLMKRLEQDRWFTIPFLRVAPAMPFAAANYAFGLTRLPFWPYLFWSEVAMIPMNALFVLSGDTLFSALLTGKTPWSTVAIVTGGSLLLLLAKWWSASRGNEGVDGAPGEC